MLHINDVALCAKIGYNYIASEEKAIKENKLSDLLMQLSVDVLKLTSELKEKHENCLQSGLYYKHKRNCKIGITVFCISIGGKPMFYLVRHGEPDYSERNTKIYQGFGEQLCPLTAKGCEQIKQTAHDERLKDASIILTSPYTRAIQTAAILSKELGIDILIETDLHEWLANKHYIYEDYDTALYNLEEFDANNGCYPNGEEKDWESFELMKNRAIDVLQRYKDYGNVIVACHGRLMQALTGLHHPSHGEIFKLEL